MTVTMTLHSAALQVLQCSKLPYSSKGELLPASYTAMILFKGEVRIPLVTLSYFCLHGGLSVGHPSKVFHSQHTIAK